jgi:hypothetical protein
LPSLLTVGKEADLAVALSSSSHVGTERGPVTLRVQSPLPHAMCVRAPVSAGARLRLLILDARIPRVTRRVAPARDLTLVRPHAQGPIVRIFVGAHLELELVHRDHVLSLDGPPMWYFTHGKVSRCEMEFAKRANSGPRDCAKMGRFWAAGKEEEEEDVEVAWVREGCASMCNKHCNENCARMTLRHETPTHVRSDRVLALQARVRIASAIRVSRLDPFRKGTRCNFTWQASSAAHGNLAPASPLLCGLVPSEPEPAFGAGEWRLVLLRNGC